MPVLNTADALYLGDRAADAVYLGDALVWSSAPPAWDPADIPGCVLGLDATDVPSGVVTTWPDRSPMANHLAPYMGTPTAYGEYVTASTNNVLTTQRNLGIVGNAPSHLLMRVRSRALDGAFMGWGEAAGSALFDLWYYLSAGSLIWHGHGGNNDTVAGAPAFAPDVWHVVEVTYENGRIQVGVDELTPAVKTGLALNIAANPLLLGRGRYSPGGDFDLSGLFIYDRVLTDTERSQVIDYLTGGSGAGWTPASIPGLGLWLEADAITAVNDGGQITAWPDQGPKHYAVTSAPSGPSWMQAAVGGKPSLLFNSTQRLLIQGWGNELSGKSEYTLFHIVSSLNIGNWPIVLTAPTYSTWQFLTEFDITNDFYWGQINGSYGLYDTNTASGAVHLLTCSISPATGANFYQDGVWTAKVGGVGITGTAVPPLGGDVYLGQYYDGSLGLHGHIPALLWYDRFLIDSERQQIETYLMTKYGIGAP
jgi:hypothetical protein